MPQKPLTQTQNDTPKIAIVQDWLIGGGAERVIEELHAIYPDAPIFTSYCTSEWRTRLDHKVVTGFLQLWPFNKLRKFVGILRIWWFSRLDLSQYDIVISCTGNGEAKGVRVRPDATHICYCHTPTHYYWRHYDQYLAQPGFGFFDPLARLGLKLLVRPLRHWDYKAAQRPDFFIANSTHIQNEIKQFYGRSSTVIFPPVDTERFNHIKPQKRHGFVWASRQVPAKRVDIIIQACNQLQLPLTIIGRGPEHQKYLALAGPTINFLTEVNDQDLAAHFAQAEAFLFASYEDFGVTPVEAQAAGTPVIAYKAGGALDYVVEGKTGLFFQEQTAESLVAALKELSNYNFDQAYIKKQAERFSIQRFRGQMSSFVSQHHKEHLKTAKVTDKRSASNT